MFSRISFLQQNNAGNVPSVPEFPPNTHQTFDSQFFHEVHKPLHGSSGFDPHTHWSWKAVIKLSHHAAFVLQSRLHYLACGAVQHRQRLLASVQITSYNPHLGLLRSELCRVNTEQSTRAVARPASLRHQSSTSRSFAFGTGAKVLDESFHEGVIELS